MVRDPAERLKHPAYKAASAVSCVQLTGQPPQFLTFGLQGTSAFSFAFSLQAAAAVSCVRLTGQLLQLSLHLSYLL